MNSVLSEINESMVKLLPQYGSYHSIRRGYLERFGGTYSESSLTRRKNGELEWTLPEVLLLEDGTKQPLITNILHRRLHTNTFTPVKCLITQSGKIAKETGEAVAALLNVQISANSLDRARAAVEIQEAIDALKAAKAALSGDSPTVVPLKGQVR